MNRLDIWTGISGGNLEEVRRCVAAGISVNVRDNDQATPLIVASLFGENELIEYLIKKRANVNVQDRFGSTPLHQAASSAHERAVSILLDANADVTLKNRVGKTPLRLVQEQEGESFQAARRKKVIAILKENESLVEQKGENDASRVRCSSEAECSLLGTSREKFQQPSRSLPKISTHQKKVDAVRRLQNLLNEAKRREEAAESRLEEDEDALASAIQSEKSARTRESHARAALDQASQAELYSRFNDNGMWGSNTNDSFNVASARGDCERAAEDLRSAQLEIQNVKNRIAASSEKVDDASDARDLAQQDYEQAVSELTPPPSPPSGRARRVIVGESHNRNGITSTMVDDGEGHVTYKNYASQSTVRSSSSTPSEKPKPKRYIAVSLLGDKAGRAWERVYDFATKKWIAESEVRIFAKTYDVIYLNVDSGRNSYYYYNSNGKIYVRP